MSVFSTVACASSPLTARGGGGTSLVAPERDRAGALGEIGPARSSVRKPDPKGCGGGRGGNQNIKAEVGERLGDWLLFNWTDPPPPGPRLTKDTETNEGLGMRSGTQRRETFGKCLHMAAERWPAGNAPKGFLGLFRKE